LPSSKCVPAVEEWSEENVKDLRLTREREVKLGGK